MAVASNAVNVFTGSGNTIMPTAPLIEGLTPPTFFQETGYGSPGGPGWSQPTGFVARYGARLTFAAAIDFTSHPYASFCMGTTSFGLTGNMDTVANGGMRIIFIDGSGNYAGFNIHGSDTPEQEYNSNGSINGFFTSYAQKVVAWYIDRTRTPNISSGTVNWANVTAVEFSIKNTSSSGVNINIGQITKRSSLGFTGTETLASIASGAAGLPSNVQDDFSFVAPPMFARSASQSVYACRMGLNVGNGSTATSLTASAFAFGFDNTIEGSPTYPLAGPFVQLATSTIRYFLVNQSATDVLSLTDGSLASSGYWGYKLQGSGSATCTRVTFLRFAEFTAAHGTYTSCTWNAGTAPVIITASTVLTGGTILNATTTGLRITGAAGTYAFTCSFDNPTATADIELGSGGAGTYTLANITVASGYTIKIRNNSATNAITVAIPTGMLYSTSTAGGSITISTPSLTRGLAFTGLLAGSQVVVYDTGTTTERFRTNSSGTSETWSEITTGSVTVDYTIMIAGRRPIRVVGITVTAALSGGVVSTPISQLLDRSYVASTGLIFTTNCTINAGTKIATWNIATTVQNFYSFAITAWIAQSSLRNVAFPFSSNGPNSFTFGDGWEIRGFSTAGTAISNTSLSLLSRDGLRYVSGAGVENATFAALYSVEPVTGLQINYQQVDGSGTTAAQTTGRIDQLIQVFGTTSYGNFDRRGFLALKIQKDGYDQAETDVVATYGNLEDQLYIVGLNPLSNGLATGAPTVAGSPTITDHGASPVTWNAKQFSITITDSAAGNSGTTLMRWIRYNLGLGGTFQGKDAFNWHDMVQTNGSGFKTVRGAIYGDTGAALKGVRVLTNAGAVHPDFNLHTADDGTTYAPPQQVAINITGLVAGSQIQIYDTLNSTQLYNGNVAGTSYTFSETYSVNRTVRLRIAKVAGATAYDFVEVNIGSVNNTTPTYTLNYEADQVLDTTYNDNAVDGSAVTGITFTDAATDLVNCNIAGGSVTWATIYAAFVYWNSTSTGIANDFTYISAPDTANYILAGMKVKNTGGTPLSVISGYGYDATTRASVDIIDTTGGSIFLAPDHVVPFATGSGVTGGDITSIAAAVLSAASATPIASDIKKVNNYTISGDGAGSPWGP